MLARLARTCFRHRRITLATWILLLIGTITLSGAVGGHTVDGARLPGTDSQQARDLLQRQFPQRSGDPGAIVFGNLAGHRPAIDRYLASVARVPDVTEVDPVQTAPGGRIAIAPITLADRPGGAGPKAAAAAAARIQALAQPLQAEGVDIAFAGDWFSSGGMPATEAIGLLAAVVILIVAFGSVVAMGLPIATALFGLGIATAALGLVARIFTTPSFAPEVAAMIGIGVGIDYALFIVTRYRDALGRRGAPEPAVVEALSTAGRAVTFAGCTVVVSLLGMFVMGLDFLHGLAVGTSVAVAIAVAAAVTLLPALLGFVGTNIDRLHVGRRRGPGRRGGWARWAGFVQRHPRPLAAGGLALLLLMALPALGMRLGFADAGNDPPASTTRQAFDLVSGGFGAGVNGPIVVVADTRTPGSAAALPRLVSDLRATAGVASVSGPVASPVGPASVVTVTPGSGPQAGATAALLHRIRSHVVPRATSGTGLVVHVGGETAGAIDFSTVISSRLALFFGAVLAVSFLLLLVVFRSVLVPLKAVVMNMLSIGAAFGAMVAVFQQGHGGGLLGVTPGPIESWAPMMLFAIVFGLSMDYEVFLLSSVREHYDLTGDNSWSVSAGLAGTARVITAAATVMVVVFASFLLSDVRGLKEIGLGLAVAVAIDATVVRVVLVPATMELLGRANWWLPGWLGRLLPRVTVEGGALSTPIPGRAAPVGVAAGPASAGAAAGDNVVAHRAG